jgi:hypothetical protein
MTGKMLEYLLNVVEVFMRVGALLEGFSVLIQQVMHTKLGQKQFPAAVGI